MATIERFEDIEAWKRARELTKQIYRITSTQAFARDHGLREQIRCSSVSILSNIAEGFERDSRNEFRQFLSIAKGSAGEVKAQLYVALDAELISRDDFDQLYRLANDIGNMIGGFIRYLNTSDIKGSKFKRDALNT